MNNEAIALYNEGYYYYSASNGYPLNYKKAYEYFLKSAALGYGDAINYLGCMYLDGKGVEKNLATAIEWFKKGVQVQNHWAMYNLGRLHIIGQGVEKNEQIAMDLFQRSYALGKNPNAAYHVGCDLMKNKKYLEAAECFQLSAKHTNMPEAWHNLGVLFGNGYITMAGESTVQSAYNCFNKAAKQGFAQSMYECGRMLIRERREQEGDQWLYLAANEGYEPAKKLLRIRNLSKIL